MAPALSVPGQRCLPTSLTYAIFLSSWILDEAFVVVLLLLFCCFSLIIYNLDFLSGNNIFFSFSFKNYCNRITDCPISVGLAAPMSFSHLSAVRLGLLCRSWWGLLPELLLYDAEVIASAQELSCS